MVLAIARAGRYTGHQQTAEPSAAESRVPNSTLTRGQIIDNARARVSSRNEPQDAKDPAHQAAVASWGENY